MHLLVLWYLVNLQYHKDNKLHIWKILSTDHLLWGTLFSTLRNPWIPRNIALAFKKIFIQILNSVFKKRWQLSYLIRSTHIDVGEDSVLVDANSCLLVYSNWRFEGSSCLHLQGEATEGNFTLLGRRETLCQVARPKVQEGSNIPVTLFFTDAWDSVVVKALRY